MRTDDQGPERAYIALPILADPEGTGIALKWCLDRTSGKFEEIELRLEQKNYLHHSTTLQRMVNLGVKVSLETAKGSSEHTDGPLIAFVPSVKALCKVEDEGRNSAVVAVEVWGPEHDGASPGYVGVQPWVTAFRPACLGGQAIEAKDPIIADPVVWQAMKTFTHITNHGRTIIDPRDKSRVVDGLKNHLRPNGHQFDPGDLLAAALRESWRGSGALILRDLAAEINRGKQKQVREKLRSDVLAMWRNDSSQG